MLTDTPMKQLIILPIFLLFSHCVKKEIGYNPPQDIIDTTLGRVAFDLNGTRENNFHIYAHRINNKIVLTYGKNKAVDNQLMTFQYFDICLDNRSLEKQPLVKLYTEEDVKFLDSTKAWSRFSTMADDGDAGCEFFELEQDGDSAINWIQVTRQNNDFKEVWGVFSVNLVKTQDCSERFYSDRLVIRNGYFHAIVK